MSSAFLSEGCWNTPLGRSPKGEKRKPSEKALGTAIGGLPGLIRGRGREAAPRELRLGGGPSGRCRESWQAMCACRWGLEGGRGVSVREAGGIETSLVKELLAGRPGTTC